MNELLASNKTFTIFSRTCWLLFFVSFICSFRGLTSISTGLLVLVSIFENKNDINGFFKRAFAHPFFIACALFYTMQFISLLYTDNIHEGWGNIRIKSELFFIPLALCGSGPINEEKRNQLFSWFCFIVGLALLYCLIINIGKYQYWHYTSVFFYHALVRPLSQHAVYFSIYVFTALIFVLESIKKSKFIFNKAFHIFLAVYFSIFLFLLSSKLIIAFYGIYLVYYFYGLLKKNMQNFIPLLALFIVLIVTGISVLVIKNPVSNRFYEILHGNLEMINHDKFDRGEYFNGLQFRALQWRFTPDILSHTHRWLTGVSPGDAQYYLDQEYITRNMFIGDPATGTRGFLGYNTHNQFLQALLQTGIIGLLLFILITGCMARIAWKSRNTINTFIIILLIVYSLSESVFQTQYGILLYTFFPLFTRPYKPNV